MKLIRTRKPWLIPLVLFALAGPASCGGTSDSSSGDGGGGDTKLTLVAYSTPEEAYKELIPAFNKTSAGKGVSFDQSYAASGEQSRAVEGGLPADVVEFSLEPDMTRLVDAGLVDKDWNQNKYDGFVTNSIVVLVTRKGNPKNIRSWDDLTTGDVETLVPNPFTSGGAKWDIMAAYGAQLEKGKSAQEAEQYLAELFTNVPVLDKSARESLQTFTSGKGDVLLAYENEAYFSRMQGLDLQWIIPKTTILIENPIAVNKTTGDKTAANAFLRFLRTPGAQQVFADYGYRPVVKSVENANRKKFPVRPGLFTIDQLGLGGWTKVQKRFFDPNSSIMARFQKIVGGSTG